MEKVEWGWVVMGKPKRMNAWLSKWRSHCSGVHLINNKAHDSFGIPGSNAYFEFSGYLEVLNCMKTEGPYVIANDTWFKTHNAFLWTGLLRNFRQKQGSEVSIYGDIRKEISPYPEKPSPYLSSWIFYIPNKTVLGQFQTCLKQAIASVEQGGFSHEYVSYVEDWLKPKNRLYGWHMASHESGVLERKRRCIYIEHQLNLELLKAGVHLVSLGYQQNWRYGLLRWLDRLQTRLNAWGFYPFV